VIINTNIEFSRWVDIFYDEQMTGAIVDSNTSPLPLTVVFRTKQQNAGIEVEYMKLDV